MPAAVESVTIPSPRSPLHGKPPHVLRSSLPLALLYPYIFASDGSPFGERRLLWRGRMKGARSAAFQLPRGRERAPSLGQTSSPAFLLTLTPTHRAPTDQTSKRNSLASDTGGILWAALPFPRCSLFDIRHPTSASHLEPRELLRPALLSLLSPSFDSCRISCTPRL